MKRSHTDEFCWHAYLKALSSIESESKVLSRVREHVGGQTEQGREADRLLELRKTLSQGRLSGVLSKKNRMKEPNFLVNFDPPLSEPNQRN